MEPKGITRILSIDKLVNLSIVMVCGYSSCDSWSRYDSCNNGQPADHFWFYGCGFPCVGEWNVYYHMSLGPQV